MAWPKGKSRKATLADQEGPRTSQETPMAAWANIKHFSPRDFTCTCTEFCSHPVGISVDFVKKLDAIRERIGRHINIASGTRCERHNRKVGGSPQSSHVTKDGISHAADVHCPDSHFRFAFLEAALPLFNRIGLGKDFIHVDDDPDLPARVIWVYGPDRSADSLNPDKA